MDWGVIVVGQDIPVVQVVIDVSVVVRNARANGCWTSSMGFTGTKVKCGCMKNTMFFGNLNTTCTDA